MNARRDAATAARLNQAAARFDVALAQMQSLNRLRVTVPACALALLVAIGVALTAAGVNIPPTWWALFAAALPASAWWILEAACRSQRRAVLRAEALHDAAWAAAARQRAHLELIAG